MRVRHGMFRTQRPNSRKNLRHVVDFPATSWVFQADGAKGKMEDVGKALKRGCLRLLVAVHSTDPPEP
jgi:hypothetical protein